MSQQNSGQSSGHSGSPTNAGSGMTNGSMLEMLDMAQDNWTEMLLKRVEKSLAGGKESIDFNLNPKNLGKMRITLLVQNNQTNVHIQTETVSAAQALGDAESRLVQMMEASGLKFGSLNSQHNQNFGSNLSGQQSGQDRNSANGKNKNTNEAEGNGLNNAEIGVGPSENLINMQA
jgi:flagellar hook-length control protein FliK